MKKILPIKNPISTKTKNKVQTTGSKIIIFFIGAITLICVIAPYLHIFIDRTSTVKVFGFRNLRSFGNALGLPCSLFFISSYLLYITKNINNATQKKQTKIISFLFLWSSFFQFIWIFWHRQDLSRSAYYISIFVLSISVAVVYFSIILFRKKLINEKANLLSKYKEIVLMLNTYIYSVEKDLKEEVKDEHSLKRGELVKKVLENVG